MLEMAEEKVAAYDPEENENDTEWQGEKLGWFHMVLRYADFHDHLLLWSGLFGAATFGGCLPGFCLFFGNMIDGVGEVSATASATAAGASAAASGGLDLETQAYLMIGVGAFAMVVSWWQVACLSVFAERICHKIRLTYFKSVLEKDAEWFDSHNPTEMASKIAKECITIQRGSGEKIGQLCMATSGFFLGFVFAFVWGWLYTLILFGMAPIIALTGIFMAMSMEKGFEE
jgi:ABC-type multidrug transport system fused ATPase/permease subunit